MSDTQEWLDTFYWQHGPCCAGCDWWRHLTTGAGECRKSKPMPGADRLALIGITNCSLPVGAGHAFTRNDHHCGDFKDDFDWQTLPLPYRKRVGAPL